MPSEREQAIADRLAEEAGEVTDAERQAAAAAGMEPGEWRAWQRGPEAARQLERDVAEIRGGG